MEIPGQFSVEIDSFETRSGKSNASGECGVTAAHELEGAAHEATGRAAQALIDTR
jgi:hypothetical protein